MCIGLWHALIIILLILHHVAQGYGYDKIESDFLPLQSYIAPPAQGSPRNSCSYLAMYSSSSSRPSFWQRTPRSGWNRGNTGVRIWGQHRRHDTISPMPGELVTIIDYMGHQSTSVRCIGALSMMIIDRRRGNELQRGKTLFLIQFSNNSTVNDPWTIPHAM